MRSNVPLSPDGVRYLALSPPRPFCWRWLLPALTGRDRVRWQRATFVSLAALPVLAGLYADDWRAGLFVAGFAGVLHVNVRFPVLVDATAMAFALCAALDVPWPLVVVMSLLAGATSERAPVFAALWAWSPLPLVGLVAAGWWRKSGVDPCADIPHAGVALGHPFRSAWRAHRRLPVWVWVLPWGAGLAAFAVPSVQLWATVAAAYAMCVVATDTVRLYQWAWPVVTVAALSAIPAAWLLPVLLAHVANPFRTEGI